MSSRRGVERPWLGTLAAAILLALVLFAGWTSADLLTQAEPISKAAITVAKPVIETPTPTPVESYEVANLSGSVDKYDEPGGKVIGTVDGTWYGYPSKLPVYEKQDGYLLVGVQIRPNESKAWIKEDAVKLTKTSWRVKVDLSERRVYVYKKGEEQWSAPVGIGKKSTPTPTGSFFMAMKAASPSAGYGPFVMAISAHSVAIQSWQGSGDAIIAFHGPVGSDAQIGTKGAAISNGCLRMHVEDLEKLGKVLPGSPVDIVK
ncbi:MAG: L,D-transpeptidase [Propionibacteriaceae bacterium]|jgi:lipoprotein-anchoring transpeptidase ErfK/SrfK|nr:L,D-transpeptidase [Propionibacteriaceae bacterium]